jgi:arginyl-tRNA synthetase
MKLADRTGDMTRLIAEHPWLIDVIDVNKSLPDARPDSELAEQIVAAATSDMGLLGVKIDTFDRESTLSIEPTALVSALADRTDMVRINGTVCLRLPAGLVPVQRGDGSLLYFARDVANTRRRRPTEWSAMLHVIGAEQTLLQTALCHAVPDAPLEHITFGQVSHAGRRYSARQARLTAINAVLRNGGARRVYELALVLALQRRTRAIDLARVDTTRPLQVVMTAAHTAPRTPGALADPHSLQQLLIALLCTPSVLARDVDRRTIHGTAQHLMLLSRLYNTVAKSGAVPDEAVEWFRVTQARLSLLLGIPHQLAEPPTPPDQS